MPLRPDIIEKLNRMPPETAEQLSKMSERDFKVLHAATDLIMLAGEGEPDVDARIEHGWAELRRAYIFARNAKAGMKFVAAIGATFFAALQWGNDIWSHIKNYLAFLTKGGGS